MILVLDWPHVMVSRGAMHSPRIHFVADHDQPRRPSNPRRRSLESPRHKRAASMLPYTSTSESDPALAAFSDEYDLCTPSLSSLFVMLTSPPAQEGMSFSPVPSVHVHTFH